MRSSEWVIRYLTVGFVTSTGVTTFPDHAQVFPSKDKATDEAERRCLLGECSIMTRRHALKQWGADKPKIRKDRT